MFNRAEIKKRAKQQLGNGIFTNNWLFAIVAAVIGAAAISVSATVVVGPLLITGPITFGLAYLFLKQARDGKQMDLKDMLTGFTGDFATNFLLHLLRILFIALWSLLFWFPGIVKTYSYSMVFFVKADHPDYDWHQCFAESKRITKGHKMDLFVLDLSFIGWFFVGMLCLGVGVIWVEAYASAAKAQAYEVIKNGNQEETQN